VRSGRNRFHRLNRTHIIFFLSEETHNHLGGGIANVFLLIENLVIRTRSEEDFAIGRLLSEFQLSGVGDEIILFRTNISINNKLLI
jgi:hypothetical protein